MCMEGRRAFLLVIAGCGFLTGLVVVLPGCPRMDIGGWLGSTMEIVFTHYVGVVTQSHVESYVHPSSKPGCMAVATTTSLISLP